MRLIFEKAETGLFVLDERGVLESWNPAFVRLLHLTAKGRTAFSRLDGRAQTATLAMLDAHGEKAQQDIVRHAFAGAFLGARLLFLGMPYSSMRARILADVTPYRSAIAIVDRPKRS